jgi:hypothetical protein
MTMTPAARALIDTERAKKAAAPIRATKPTPDLYGEMYRNLVILTEFLYSRVGKFMGKHKERVGLGNDLLVKVNFCAHLVIDINAFNPFNDREKLLRQLHVELKMINFLSEVCYKQRLITAHQLEAIARRVRDVDGIAVGLAMWLQREREKHEKS